MMMAKLSPGISSPATAEMIGWSSPSIVWKANWMSQNVTMRGRRSTTPRMTRRARLCPTRWWTGAGWVAAVMGPPGAGWGGGGIVEAGGGTGAGSEIQRKR